jgi:hypothetical protein
MTIIGINSSGLRDLHVRKEATFEMTNRKVNEICSIIKHAFGIYVPDKDFNSCCGHRQNPLGGIQA